MSLRQELANAGLEVVKIPITVSEAFWNSRQELKDAGVELIKLPVTIGNAFGDAVADMARQSIESTIPDYSSLDRDIN